MTVVTFRHLVPVEYVPRGGRHARLNFMPVETPVRLPEADRSDLPHLGNVKQQGIGSIPVHAHGDGAWVRLNGTDATDLAAVTDLHCLVPHNRHWKELPWNALNDTPLCPRIPFDKGFEILTGRPPSGRLHDGTERARADITRFVEDNVVLHEGVPCVRLTPMFTLVPHQTPRRFTGNVFHWMHERPWAVTVPRRMDENFRYFKERASKREKWDYTPEVRGFADVPLQSDDWSDLVFFAEKAPLLLQDMIHQAVGMATAANVAAPFRELAPAVNALVTDGLYRAVGREGLQAGVRRIIELADALGGLLPAHPHAHNHWISFPDAASRVADVAAYGRAVIVPGIETAMSMDVMAPEDEAAFDGMGYGR